MAPGNGVMARDRSNELAMGTEHRSYKADVYQGIPVGALLERRLAGRIQGESQVTRTGG